MISSRRAGLSTSTISSTFLLTQLTLLLLPTSANALNSQVISYILPPSVLQELRDGWNGLVNLYDTTMTYHRIGVIGSAVFLALTLLTFILVYLNIHSWKDFQFLFLPLGMILTLVAHSLKVVLYLEIFGSSSIYRAMLSLFKLGSFFYFFFIFFYFSRLTKALNLKNQSAGINKKLVLMFNSHSDLLVSIFGLGSLVGAALLVVGEIGLDGPSFLTGSYPALGKRLMIIGSVLQLTTYVFFLANIIKAHSASKKIMVEGLKRFESIGSSFLVTDQIVRRGVGIEVGPIFRGIYLSSVFLVIRFVYQLVLAINPRLSQGTKEILFITLDSLPLLLSVLIYVVWYPTSLYPISTRLENSQRAFIPFYDVAGRRNRNASKNSTPTVFDSRFEVSKQLSKQIGKERQVEGLSNIDNLELHKIMMSGSKTYARSHNPFSSDLYRHQSYRSDHSRTASHYSTSTTTTIQSLMEVKIDESSLAEQIRASVELPRELHLGKEIVKTPEEVENPFESEWMEERRPNAWEMQGRPYRLDVEIDSSRIFSSIET